MATFFQPVPLQPVNPLLANGQIAQRVPLNVVGSQPGAAPPPQATITSQFANGQLNVGTRLIQQQLVGTASPVAQQTLAPQIQFATQSPQFDSNQSPFDAFLLAQQQGGGSSGGAIRFEDDSAFGQRSKREDGQSRKNKRGLVMLKDGSIVDDTLVSIPNLFDGLTQFGAQEFKDEAAGNQQTQNDLEDEIREHDREPAEGEVQAVMSLCSKCQIEPFQGAVVLAWRELQTITQHALKAMSTGHCGDF